MACASVAAGEDAALPLGCAYPIVDSMSFIHSGCSSGMACTKPREVSTGCALLPAPAPLKLLPAPLLLLPCG